MTKFFNKFKKTLFLAHFWSTFPILGKNFFSGKSSSIRHNIIWISDTMPKFRKKLMVQFQVNAQTDGRWSVDRWSVADVGLSH